MRDRLEELRETFERRVIGLNCGTSMDGIDAVLLTVSGAGFDVRFKTEEFFVDPLPSGLVDRLRRFPEVDAAEVADLDIEMAERLAAAAKEVARRAGLARSDVHLVGSHGVTVYHRPARRAGERTTTLQIGDISVISERMETPVVGDFRRADVAAGGHGAPLMPWLDYVVFRDHPGTLVVNLGGIANITHIASSLEDVRAFDTGPANLPLDELARRLSQGAQGYDVDGRLAATGHVDSILLDQLMAHPYIVAKPPKTTGREDFGARWVSELLSRHEHMKLVDILATCTAFVAHAIRHACDEWLPEGPLRRVVVSGGGCHNLTLMGHLRKLFDPVPVETSLDHVCDPDAKEAILFALLANDRVFGRPSNLPSATGAAWPVSLGKVVW